MDLLDKTSEPEGSEGLTSNSKIDAFATDTQPVSENFPETEALPEDSLNPIVNERSTNAHPQNRSFQTKKRIWTIALTSLLAIGLIAACIKAIEPVGNQAASGTLNTNAVANSQVPVAEATTAPVSESEVITSESTSTTSESSELAAEEPATTEAVAAAPQQPVVASGTYNGMPVGFTAEGYPFRGSSDAPVTVYEFSDFQCPFCSRYFVQTEPSINESFVRTGKLRVVFRDMPLVELHPNAPAAHQAANCVAQQSAELYWAMHDQLFRSQNEWSRLPDPLAVFSRIVGEISADATAYESCMTSGETKSIVDASLSEAFTLGFSGTPSFRFVSNASGGHYDLIGAQPYDQFESYIETIAAGGAPVDSQAQAQQQQGGDGGIPFWATAEGLAPNPERPGVNMAGDYYRGDINAPVTVIEFSDFQCPYCRRHTTETQPALDEQFVATSQVLWVFKSFPLSIHPQAPAASVAAECAGEQGKFWEMSDLLFSDPGSWSFDPPTAVFSGYAQQLSLDVTAFDACQQNPDIQKRVQDDMNDGSALVRGTPSFIILKDGQGRIIPGALPKEQFITALEDVVTNGFSQ